MQSVQKLPNAAASKITVTSTATLLEDLIETAAGEGFSYAVGTNAVDLFVETNNVRWLDDGNTPTTAVGHLVQAGGTASLRGAELTELYLIATGADATVSVRVGQVNPQ